MNTSALKDLVKTIEKTKTLAESDAGYDVQTRRIRLGKINRAKEDLKGLYEEYRNELKSRSAIILLTGSKSKKFNDIATSEEFGCFSVDGDEFYNEITSRINSRLFTDEMASPSLFNLINDKFEEVAVDLGIVSYPMMRFESKYKKILKDKKDLIDLTKKAFNDKVGGEVVGLYALNKVVPKAAAEGFAGKIVPVLLHCEDESLALSLEQDLKKMFSNVFIVTAGEVSEEVSLRALTSADTASKKSVGESLLKIKESL